MPEVDGLQLLQRLHGEVGAPAVIMISGHGNIETAVKATKLGAFDFIEKPFSLDGLLRVVNRALDHHAAQLRRAEADAGANGRPAADSSAEGSVVSVAPGRRTHRWSERTIARSVVASGTGLHSGMKTGLILQPLPPGSGILFTNLSTDESVPAHLDWVDSTG